MKTDWTPETLIAFERDIAETFNRGEIRAPVHLAGGNEEVLIEIFDRIAERDWVCGTWRAHYHCLLKGVPADELKAAIVAGRSIALCFPERRVICSAMVGGIVPLALGLAWASKRDGVDHQVWCFVGDMAMRSGLFQECEQYAVGHRLPIHFIVEDNRKSVATDTRAAWGQERRLMRGQRFPETVEYDYDLEWPHVGTGKFVIFPDNSLDHKSHGL
jgi:TPP-dependent pyruvate/acetoin dehydrogenase alpha subunit